jgi:plastocyanin
MTARWGRWVLAVSVVAMTATACGGSARADATAVSIEDGAFEDATLVVPAGTEVRWTNHGSQRHTVTGGPVVEGAPIEATDPAWDSGPLRPGETFSHRFTQEGLYFYWCSYHREEQMLGTVRVEEP